MDSDRRDQWKPASKPRTSFSGEVHVAAAVAAMLAVMTLGSGLLTEGGLRVLFFALSALAAVYALYVLVVLAGWHRVEWVIDRALGATAEGQHQLQVRVPIARKRPRLQGFPLRCTEQAAGWARQLRADRTTGCRAPLLHPGR
jgi:hypothetical protein